MNAQLAALTAGGEDSFFNYGAVAKQICCKMLFFDEFENGIGENAASTPTGSGQAAGVVVNQN